MEQECTTIAVQRVTWMSWPAVRPRNQSSVPCWTGPSAAWASLCGVLLHRSYPRLMQPPLSLQADELLSAVVERLLKALREARPTSVRQFFALAGQHMRWELNDMARRLDEQPGAVQLNDEQVPAPASSDSVLSPDARRMLGAIDNLPEGEREAFDLVRIQGMAQAEAARVLGVSPMTVMRRLNRALLLLANELDDLRPQ